MLSRVLSSLNSLSWVAPRWRLVLLCFASVPLLTLAALAAVTLFTAPSPPAGPAAAPGVAGGENGEAGSLPPPGGLLVEVTGAVAHPGLFRVAKGERVSAAIAAAGGLTSDADPERLPSMAARLKDGEQVRVPSLLGRGRTATAPRPAGGTGTGRSSSVSLNLATADQLAAIPGFSPELAAAAISYRTEYGGFATTRELIDVLNMSEADYLRARKYISV